MVMMNWQEVADLIGGNLLSGGHRPIQRVSNQPNLPKGDSLYFLLRGISDERLLRARLVAHQAAGAVIQAGMNVSPPAWAQDGLGLIEVPNLTSAYLRMAEYYRSKIKLPVVQVIGSSGKTTTKDMVGAVLREQGPTLTSKENLNSVTGMAYNLFRLEDGQHWAAAFEAGMTEYGEILQSTAMTKPSIGILTAIHRAHLLRLGSIDNIIKAKSEMLQHLDPSGCLILNGADPTCAKYPVQKYAGRVIRFGFSPDCDIWADGIRCEGEWTHFTAHHTDFQVACKIHTFGRYNVGNALAALIAGVELGMTPEMAALGLSKYEPAYARLQLHQGRDGMTLVDDNFNANPDSTRMLLEEIPQFAQGRSLVLVLGDMERGGKAAKSYARSVHEDIGRQLGGVAFHRLIAVGRWADAYLEGARQAGVDPAQVRAFRTAEEAREHLLVSVLPGCVVLFKASPYTNLHGLLDELKQ